MKLTGFEWNCDGMVLFDCEEYVYLSLLILRKMKKK